MGLLGVRFQGELGIGDRPWDGEHLSGRAEVAISRSAGDVQQMAISSCPACGCAISKPVLRNQRVARRESIQRGSGIFH